jgi:hypothetical protein
MKNEKYQKLKMMIENHIPKHDPFNQDWFLEEEAKFAIEPEYPKYNKNYIKIEFLNNTEDLLDGERGVSCCLELDKIEKLLQLNSAMLRRVVAFKEMEGNKMYYRCRHLSSNDIIRLLITTGDNPDIIGSELREELRRGATAVSEVEYDYNDDCDSELTQFLHS